MSKSLAGLHKECVPHVLHESMHQNLPEEGGKYSSSINLSGVMPRISHGGEHTVWLGFASLTGNIFKMLNNFVLSVIFGVSLVTIKSGLFAKPDN